MVANTEGMLDSSPTARSRSVDITIRQVAKYVCRGDLMNIDHFNLVSKFSIFSFRHGILVPNFRNMKTTTISSMINIRSLCSRKADPESAFLIQKTILKLETLNMTVRKSMSTAGAKKN